MELARYGVPYSEVVRDPRPSHLAALLDAGRVVDARFRLEDTDDTVNAGGVQGEVKETGGPPKPPPKGPPIRTELVGFNKRQDELRRRAYPEEFTALLVLERRKAIQQQKAAEFWGMGSVTQATAMKFRIVREGGEVSVVAVQAGHPTTGEGTERGPQDDTDGNPPGGD